MNTWVLFSLRLSPFLMRQECGINSMIRVLMFLARRMVASVGGGVAIWLTVCKPECRSGAVVVARRPTRAVMLVACAGAPFRSFCGFWRASGVCGSLAWAMRGVLGLSSRLLAEKELTGVLLPLVASCF
uniref:Uncharacterized protein n=1 Tax=Coptotermes formosanus TaxID=36987 RepID=R4UM01_COPFO|nr:hypothetical protein [Coptotermes formosanus]